MAAEAKSLEEISHLGVWSEKRVWSRTVPSITAKWRG